METISKSEKETIHLAQELAVRLRPGAVVLLKGPLGSGKSVFARGLIRALAGDPALEVPSPTFTLVQRYETPAGPVSHFDLYRIKDFSEVFELGWEDALYEGLTLVEWPERLGGLTPKGAVTVCFEAVPGHPDSRLVVIDGTFPLC